MTIIKDVRQTKALLLIIAIIIAVSSLYISNLLVRDLSIEEKNKMEVWAEAMRTMNTADGSMDLNLVLKVLNANNTIPVVAVDGEGHIQLHRNLKIEKDTVAYLRQELDKLKTKGRSIRILYDPDNSSDYLDIYYDESLILKRLSIYPYIQLAVVLIFVVIAIAALLSFKRSEQNKVWVGLSKETAHQLGTPISSLIAWLELLKAKYPTDDLFDYMSTDVSRLQTTANRFSKIGSIPELEEQSLQTLLNETIDYMSGRISGKVQLLKSFPKQELTARINAPLFGWVIENLIKNAIDAMDGIGSITISLSEQGKTIVIDVSDTGKGISRSNYKSVFSPGYTTKKRGWGLGLSLARRIVEEYHSGKIYVKDSQIHIGTTFRIELKK